MPSNRSAIRTSRPIIPGRQVDFTLGGSDPDTQELANLVADLDRRSAQVGTVIIPSGGFTANDVFVFDGTQWTGIDKTALLALSDVTDVVLTTPVTGEVLRYSGTAWENDPLSADDLSNESTLVRTTMPDGRNVALGTVTGSQIGTASNQKLSFWGVAPVVRPAAFTQTFATASRTHAAQTSADLTGIASSTTGTALAEPSAAYTQAELQQNFRRIQDQFNALRADLDNVKQVLNSVIDDGQSEGLLQ